MIPIATPMMPPAKPITKKFWPLRDIPTAFWLILLAVSTVIHQWVPAPRWLMLHLLFLGAISHAILVWSQHFAVALLHTPATKQDRRTQSWRLILVNLGTAVVVVGVLASQWPITSAGAAMVGIAVIWHGINLVTKVRGALGSRFAFTVRYYIAAAIFLPLGAVLGTLLSHGFADPTHAQVKLSHALLNILGWMGLTVLGTLVTLWPTMLRTKMLDAAITASQRALPVLVISVLTAGVAAVLGSLWIAGLGLAGYLAGLISLLIPFAQTARVKPPRTYATLSAGMALLWFAGSLAYLLVGLIVGAIQGNSWEVAESYFAWIAPYLAAGFGAQILVGALSYLLPVSVSSGPASVRAANRAIDKGASFRIVAANGALVVCLLPVPSLVRVLASVLYLAVMVAFLVLIFTTGKSARIAKTQAAKAGAENASRGPEDRRFVRPAADDRPKGQRAGQAMMGAVAVLLTVVLGAALDPSALGSTALGIETPLGQDAAPGGSSAVPVTPNGKTETVAVEARDMKFFPNSIKVEAGTNLIIELTNTDKADVHDLVLANGMKSGRLSPGGSATMEIGVVSANLEGWCSIIGHRQMGMTLDITVSGDDIDPSQHPDHSTMNHTAGTQKDGSAADDLDFMAPAADDFTAYDPSLPPLPPRNADGSPTVHKETFEIIEQEMEVAPGVTQMLWTFNGVVPGPRLHGRVGDIFEITLVNNGSMGHSIDFHASNLAPDMPMRTIAPGESLIYKFEATRAGIWMYHCSTMPMTAHIANGMAGAVVIEPDNLPEVDKSFVMIQSEFYLGAQGEPVDMDKVAAEKADVVTFNGYSNQYVDRPVEAKVGERVRIWVLDVGPSRATSFHIVGGQFDRVWFEGAYILGDEKAPADPRLGGSQALGLQAAQGGFVELVFPEAGNYAMVNHIMIDAERGAKGIFHITD